MAEVAVLHSNGLARDRLKAATLMDGAARARHHLEYLKDWGALTTVIGRRSAMTVAIVDAYHGGEFAIAEIEHVLRSGPGTPVIVYSDFTNKPAQDAMLLGRVGVSSVVTLGIDDDLWRIRHALAVPGASEQHPIALSLSRYLEGDTVQLVLDVYNAIGGAMESLQVENSNRKTSQYGLECLAERLGIKGRSRSGLERRLRTLGLPSPARFLLLVRLLHVGRLLDDPDRTISNIAEVTGFGGDNTLHDVIRRNANRTPGELRKQGGLTSTLELLERSIADARPLAMVRRSGTRRPS
jgi:AraC-like DNA-binding protein